MLIPIAASQPAHAVTLGLAVWRRVPQPNMD
ncbi:hypothetical protein FHW94_001784 [Novosphingobium sp. SG720]|nr:hypothetical protein [Novosphingobium sp. SG720]